MGGATVVQAAPREVHVEAQNAVPEEHQYLPLQPAPAPAPPAEVENQLLSEPIQPAAAIQVHFHSPNSKFNANTGKINYEQPLSNSIE